MADANIKTEIEEMITQEGYSAVWRRPSGTMQAAHGTPTSISVSDNAITIETWPVKMEEIKYAEGKIKVGDVRMITSFDNKIRVSDIVLKKDESRPGYTTAAGTDDTQVVIASNVQSKFVVGDYISIDDSGNTGIYEITGVSYSDPNTTLTVALDANPGDGDVIYKAAEWNVIEAQPYPDHGDAEYLLCLLRRIPN